MLVVVQVTIQVLILLLAQTETPTTTGGLETICKSKCLDWIQLLCLLSLSLEVLKI